MTLEKNMMFDTPENADALVKWLDEFKGDEKIIAMTAAMKAWNLAADIISKEQK